jgi:hypothetical protein
MLRPILSKTYFGELVPGFSPDRNQTSAEMFSGVWISIIIEKKLKFEFPVARGRKLNVVGGACFTKMAITPEVNKVGSPNLVHMCLSSIWGHSKITASIGHMVAL